MVYHEQLIFLIREYVFDNILPDYTFFNARNGYFQEQSYLLWAAEELINRITEQRTEPPVQILKGFASQMKEFSKLKQNYAFESAYKLANNILDVCRSAGWTDN